MGFMQVGLTFTPVVGVSSISIFYFYSSHQQPNLRYSRQCLIPFMKHEFIAEDCLLIIVTKLQSVAGEVNYRS